MPWLTGDDIPTDNFCRVIRVPNDPVFIHAVSGALLDLTYERNWEQQGTLTPKQQADAFDQVYLDFTQSVCIEETDLIYPKSFITHGFVGKVISGNTLQQVYNNTAMFAHYTKMTTPGINNEWEVEVLLAQGVWKFYFMAFTNNSSGHIRFKFDGVDTSNLSDFYTSAQVANVNIPIEDTIEVTSGIHRLGFKSPSKNASSSNYHMWIQAIWGTWLSDLP